MTFQLDLPKSISKSCPNCGAEHSIPVEADEDGPYCELETERCQGVDFCEVEMCEQCEVRCDSCNLPVCEQHRKLIDGKPWCEICIKEAGLDCAEAAA